MAVWNSPNETGFGADSRRNENNFHLHQKILKKAIEARGTSDSDYRDPFGRKGGYQEMLYVYGLEGEKCQKERRRDYRPPKSRQPLGAFLPQASEIIKRKRAVFETCSYI